MKNIKENLILYRERICNIENKNIEIESLRISGLDNNDDCIKNLDIEIKKMELENKKIENIIKILPNKEYKIIKLIYLEGKGKKEVAVELDRTQRQINYSINKAMQIMSNKFMY
ncbi:DNA-directed RNA polymerase sigma-70 factor [Clostridium pasteurianum]|uniref:RNA polymerase sigma factor, sigma-70 family n=1 Tax=Clostridium pasteurianum BC1 TaxID=86416 RepID=R4JX44_CLOPA|nr:DNA-directed RNA polymerase sigma-70 factor [Clostridium pasteurianum]AGK95392.1 RNA polymerase sigma factor, sigma-70 family [Clostridium pasteurianum BC1]